MKYINALASLVLQFIGAILFSAAWMIVTGTLYILIASIPLS